MEAILTEDKKPDYGNRVLVLHRYGGKWSFGRRVSTDSRGDHYAMDDGLSITNPIAWAEEPETIHRPTQSIIEGISDISL